MAESRKGREWKRTIGLEGRSTVRKPGERKRRSSASLNCRRVGRHIFANELGERRATHRD